MSGIRIGWGGSDSLSTQKIEVIIGVKGSGAAFPEDRLSRPILDEQIWNPTEIGHVSREQCGGIGKNDCADLQIHGAGSQSH